MGTFAPSGHWDQTFVSSVVCSPQGRELVLRERFGTGTEAWSVFNLHPLFSLEKQKSARAPQSSVLPSWLLLLTFAPERGDAVKETQKGVWEPFQPRLWQDSTFPSLDLSFYKLNAFLEKNYSSPHFPTKFLHSAGTPCSPK